MWEQLSHLCQTLYLNYPSLYSLPNSVSETNNILVGNGLYIGELFLISVVINLQGHIFEE